MQPEVGSGVRAPASYPTQRQEGHTRGAVLSRSQREMCTSTAGDAGGGG